MIVRFIFSTPAVAFASILLAIALMIIGLAGCVFALALAAGIVEI